MTNAFLKKSNVFIHNLFYLEKYEDEAVAHWDTFYQHYNESFFKDRNYLHNHFTELQGMENKTVDFFFSNFFFFKFIELGCGVGNTLFPLMKMSPNNTFYACDFAPHAIRLIRVSLISFTFLGKN